MSLLATDEEYLLKTISSVSADLGIKAYVVGGYPRDLFFGLLFGDQPQIDKDIDFLIDGEVDIFCSGVQAELGGEVQSYPEFLTAKILHPLKLKKLREIDFASARSEQYRIPGELPQVRRGNLQKDLARRDFTVNSMAIKVEDLLQAQAGGSGSLEFLASVCIDPFNGKEDLKNKKIRILHSDSFKDDPTRILRALRYAARYQASLGKETLSSLRESVERGDLNKIASYRILTEFKKIFKEPCFDRALSLFVQHVGFQGLGLTNDMNSDELLKDIQKMKKLVLPSSGSLTFKVAIRIFFFHADREDRQVMYRKLKFGSKFITRAEREERFVMGEQPLNELSDEGLILLLIRPDYAKVEPDVLQQEALRRQLPLAP